MADDEPVDSWEDMDSGDEANAAAPATSGESPALPATFAAVAPLDRQAKG